MKRYKLPLRAHEVTTVYNPNNMGKYLMKYMVIATTTSKAVSLVPLKEGEEVLKAEELNHHVIVEGKVKNG